MAICGYCNSQNIVVIKPYKFHNIFECQECNRWIIQKIDSCCRDPFEVLVFKYNDNIPTAIYKQCNNCGGSLTMTKPLNFKNHSKNVRGEFFSERFNQWKNEKQSEGNYIYEISKQLKFLKSTYYQYLQYLQCEQWRAVRLLALERDKWICQLCKKVRATEVHHLTYINLGNEKLEDLISYCNICHLLKHKRQL